jgi:hypothetical protein
MQKLPLINVNCPDPAFDHTRHPKEAIAATNEDQHIGFYFDPYFRSK